ncbi:putative odorant receptor 19b [Drosophila takahashii]|uniref:putative odorant receptor 19b n=1 Tax=Drosophila takahashii TaxID=29030 RepID=UPI001CF8A70B|nr:putative odorant receptor 19b [Drosophila takahashii]
MSIVEVDSTRALVSHWRIFRMIGLHPPDKATMWGRHYRAYSIAWNLAFHVCMWVSFVVNFLLSNSLETFCESLCVAMPHTLYMLKVINVYLKRDEMLHIHQLLRYLDGRLGCPEEFRIIGEGVAAAEFIFRVILRAVVGVVVLGVFYISLASEPTLMYPSWIPWNWKDTTAAYLPTIILHTFALIETAMVVLNLSTYPCTYFILISAHTKALALRVSRLGHGQSLPAHRMQAILLGYIQDHQIILHLFRSLERSLSMTCFMQFFCTACAQCTISYFLLFEEVGIMRFTNMMSLLMAFTTESLLLCYTAELLCREGESLLAAVYSCNWLDQSVHFRRLLLLMLVRCQKPLILVSGIIVPISMKTFMVMVKGAYTMLTLLNEMRKASLEYN